MEGDPEPVPLLPPPPTCSSCGKVVDRVATFCTACGAPLKDGAPRASRRLPAQHISSMLAESTAPIKQTITFYVLWVMTGVVSWIFREESVFVVAQLTLQAVNSSVTIGWFAFARRDILALYSNVLCGWGPYLTAVAAAYPIALAVSAFAAILKNTFSIPEMKISSEYLDHGYGWTVLVLSICAQPAIIEERAFRGIIQTTVAEMLKPVEAIVVSGIAFSIMHFRLPMFVPLAAIGIYLGILRHWSGSLYPPMIAHFLHNFISVVDERVRLLPF